MVQTHQGFDLAMMLLEPRADFIAGSYMGLDTPLFLNQFLDSDWEKDEE